jgi:15-cis-phytoene synthase
MTADVALLDEARSTTRRVARTFSLACRLLPRSCRDDVYLLYLVFRTLDDLVDFDDPEAEARVAAVEDWAAGGAPRSREAEVLERLCSRHDLPRHAFADFCAGMRFDLEGGENRTEDDLDRYCYQVAGTVGLAMAALLGAPGPEPAHPAMALGMAMQRTNILRDIDEDLAAGRVYLASETVERFGGSIRPGERAELMRDQIARADALYDRGIAGIALLPAGRRAVGAAAAMYREILRQIEREGYGARAGRAVVPGKRKLVVAARRAAMAR